jgi:CheY-like chemotaxis protein
MQRPVLLSVEDRDSDFQLIKMAIHHLGLDVTIFRAYDGEQAIAFLDRSGEYERSPRPSLVLLDIQIRKMDGFGVLEHAKSNESLRSIPVVMFTSSSNPREIERALAMGAEKVITKPIRFQQFKEQVESVCLDHLVL